MSIPEDEQTTLASLDNVPWKDHHEKLFLEWGDKAACYKWLHTKSYKIYTRKYQWYTIPVIIMSTLTGTANFAQDRVPIDYRAYAQMTIGGINLIAGIITTISQFLKVNELMESYRASSILWGRFYRIIKVELGKDRKDRTPVLQFLRKCQEQYDNLMETSPSIDDEVIEMFMKTFTSAKPDVIATKKAEIYKNFTELNKPDICNELVPTSKFLAPKPVEKPIQRRSEVEPVDESKLLMSNEINTFIDNFIKQKNRFPMLDEVKDNMENTEEDDVEFVYNIRKNNYNEDI